MVLEAPLAEGWVDRLQVSHPGLKYLGPVQSQARLEASKSYAKSVMTTYKIPTAPFKTFYLTETAQAHQYLDKHYSDQKLPVLKTDGLNGKGVVLPQTLQEAHTSLDRLYQTYGQDIVIEERLTGIEISLFLVCDGQETVFMPPAGDYKRRFDGDRGSNTGGMGAVAPFETAWSSQKIERLIHPSIKKLVRSIGYRGFLYVGLMVQPDTDVWNVLEFNCRLGDPETQAVLALYTHPSSTPTSTLSSTPTHPTSFYSLLYHASNGTLGDISPPVWKKKICLKCG